MVTPFAAVGGTLPASVPQFEKIGILGGTFDPPHLGHLYMARTALKEFALDEVILLPVGDPPHKRSQHVATGEDRMTMLSLMRGDESRLAISDMEIKRAGYTYTVDSLRRLTQTMPNAVFYYIIGEDTLYELETWREHEKVFSLTEFICFARPGGDGEKLWATVEFFKRRYGKDIAVSRHSGPDISSSHIRELIRQGGSTTGLLSENVRKYIDDKKLYR